VAGLNSIDERRHVPWMPDVINLDIFGTFAGAMGQPARVTDCGKTEVLEGEGKHNYHCLIISEGKMVGAQFIGNYEEIGVLLPLIGRDYAEICKQSLDEAKMVSFPWYHSARNLLL